jgi:hypothetical protein
MKDWLWKHSAGIQGKMHLASFMLDAHKYDKDYPYAPGYVTLAVIPDLNC